MVGICECSAYNIEPLWCAAKSPCGPWTLKLDNPELRHVYKCKMLIQICFRIVHCLLPLLIQMELFMSYILKRGRLDSGASVFPSIGCHHLSWHVASPVCIAHLTKQQHLPKVYPFLGPLQATAWQPGWFKIFFSP